VRDQKRAATSGSLLSLGFILSYFSEYGALGCAGSS
jgi:hypothetical protein